MNTEEVFEKVKGIIVEQLGVAEASVTMEAPTKIPLDATRFGFLQNHPTYAILPTLNR